MICVSLTFFYTISLRPDSFQALSPPTFITPPHLHTVTQHHRDIQAHNHGR